MKPRRIDTGIIQRGDSYTFTVAMGMTPEGKQIRKTTTYTPPNGSTEKKSDKLAKEEYVAFKNRCKGLSAFNENMKFKELVDEYFNVYAPNRLKPVTANSYKIAIDYHLLNYFGNKKLKDITSGMITNFLNTHTVINKENETTSISPSLAKYIYAVMQSLFSFATTQGYIKETPAKNVILPSKKATEDKKRNYLTEIELSLFLELFEGYSFLNTVVKLLLFTGMRVGECLGLQWEDIDYNTRTIAIRHTLSYVRGTFSLTTPKSRTSKRYIFMSDTIIDLLKEHKKHQLKLQILTPETFTHPELVFTSNTGYYKSASTLHDSFKRRLKGSGFEFLTPHSLRHCNATLLLNSGIDLKVVSDHLGHSGIGITADIYADVLASTRKGTAEIIEMKLAQNS